MDAREKYNAVPGNRYLYPIRVAGLGGVHFTHQGGNLYFRVLQRHQQFGQHRRFERRFVALNVYDDRIRIRIDTFGRFQDAVRSAAVIRAGHHHRHLQ
jgi:hypothetical protein